MEPVLAVEKLETEFVTNGGVFKAVDGVSFHVHQGETLGVVGESGCGKSVTSLSIMGLLPKKIGRVKGGRIQFHGNDLLQVPEKHMRSIRGNRIAMIFQEPMTSLNPVFRIGDQLAEAIQLHKKVKRKEAMRHAVDMLHKVGIPHPESVAQEYPHQLSGGMRQRVMIAMAMSCNPEVLIADEPTTALDVTIQAQILDLMRQLQEEEKTSILLITHDLGVVAEMCHRVVVMYAGQVVEEADVDTLFESPQHPYTQGLLASLPQLAGEQERLESIPGAVPSPLQMPPGCRFAPRCKYRTEACDQAQPALTDLGGGHRCRCLLVEKGVAR
ncbi:ABC transporter ATP-binding protein [Paenibacillus thiaminolyticus]|uniref:ABC transporter ATP-binding protein n=1 Tax=Paenibacillus thiaminolyticus TaxID=49283 RepID=A0A3A3GR06_PANTH|nr:ABC transporter ATP-binding protein [Paenibacillus thiaminolyticus]RJG25650.1 ABC transporter ATP-binding protein [Paenibacillus thiaminolyticus]